MSAPMALRWPYPARLAHRGGGTLAPENTLVALETGWQHGYRAAEIDAVLTADGVPVLLHDETLDRTTDGHGSIARTRLADLEGLDAGRWCGARFAGARVPTLLQVLAYCHAQGIWLNVEIKPASGCDAATGTIVARTVAGFLAEHASGATGPAPLLSSFSSTALLAARAAAPQLKRGMLFEAVPRDWPTVVRAVDACAVHCDHHHLDAARAGQITGAGLGLLCYTVNEPERVRQLQGWGVDAVCTDRPDRIAPD